MTAIQNTFIRVLALYLAAWYRAEVMFDTYVNDPHGDPKMLGYYAMEAYHNRKRVASAAESLSIILGATNV